MAAEESVTNYFSYVKNVLGVKTLQSARLRQSLQAALQPEATESCDLLFLHLKQAADQSIFAPESADLLAKMIQAMRLGSRIYLIKEVDLTGTTESLMQILQNSTRHVQTPFAVVFSGKPSSNKIQNLGPLRFLESFGPSHLLQNPSAKKLAWSDLQRVMKELGVL